MAAGCAVVTAGTALSGRRTHVIRGTGRLKRQSDLLKLPTRRLHRPLDRLMDLRGHLQQPTGLLAVGAVVAAPREECSTSSTSLTSG